MNVRTVVVGGNKVTLDDSHYIAQGGQGTIFKKNGIIFKIYHDMSALIPEDKIQELHVMRDIPNVIIPSTSVYDYKTHARIGFVMKSLDNTESLCKLFVKSFKDKHNITPHNIVDIVRNMQETLIEIHKCGVVVGDYNEMNFLMGNNFTTPYYIDVDSYQTEKYKCNAIMESVRDFTLPLGEFNELSDWYSFAVVSFQLYCGIHPTKGKHPKFKVNDFEGRQKNLISVFDKDVKVPKFVNMTGIPRAHMDWYKEVFVNGERSIPPFSDGKINYSVIQNIFLDPNASVLAELLYTVDASILDTYFQGVHHILTKSSYYVGQSKRLTFDTEIDRGEIIMTIANEAILIVEHNKVLYAYDDHKNLIKEFDGVDYQSYMVVNNCLYVMQESGLVQYSFHKIGKMKVIAKPISTLHLNSSKMFTGVVLQELYGKYKAIIPYEYDKASMVDLKELKTNRVLDAKFVGKWLFVLANNNGKIDLHKFFFDDRFKTYEYKAVADVSMRNINAIVNPNGMVVFNTEDETLELFFDFKKGTKVIDKSPLQNNLELVNGKSACFIDDDKLYGVGMK